MASFHLKVVLPEIQSDTEEVHPSRLPPIFHFRNGIQYDRRGRRIRPPIFLNGTVAHGLNIYPNEVDLSTGGDYTIVANKIIKSEDEITTLRANLNNSIDVVVKFAVGEAQARLFSQAQYYRNELKDLQGSHIPILYGVFAGDVRTPTEDAPSESTDLNRSERKDTVTPFHCLVLEDCGESLDLSSVFLQDLPKAEKQRVFLILGQFHLLGMVFDDPDDFCEEHTLRKNRQFRTIGFRKLVAHKCSFQKWNFLLIHQTGRKFGCNSLHVFASDICVWEVYPRSVDVLGVTFPRSHLLPPQRIIDAIIGTFVKVKPKTKDGSVAVLEWIMDIEEWRREELQAERIKDIEDVLKYADSTKPLLLRD